jgi:hypothetical protein
MGGILIYELCESLQGSLVSPYRGLWWVLQGSLVGPTGVLGGVLQGLV